MNKITLTNRFVELSEEMMRMFPDWITGKSEVMKQKYYKKYGARDYTGLIRKNKIRTMSAYLCIAAVFLVIFFGAMITQPVENREIISITRPGKDQTVKSVPVKVQMDYKGVVLTEEVLLRIGQKELSEGEKLELLRDFRKSLGKMILGENKDLDHISKPLILMDRDPATGITIDWTSDHPGLISESGEVNLLRAGETKAVKLKADLALDDASLAGAYELTVDPEATEEDYKRSLALSLKEQITELTKNSFSERIALPGELEEGVKVRWFSGKEEKSTFLVPVFLFMILIVYFRRYDRIDREIREAEVSLNRDLPEFINKLVLLLNAGLVFSTAFSKIIEDYESFCYNVKAGQTEKKFLYEEMLEIQKRVEQSNASLIRELKEFSQRCGVREMVRLTAVISDNWNKGSTLAEKLEAESNLLWIGRKKRAEKKGKLAETKLTFPLMILLLVLIMVTIAPAMLEM